MADISTRPRKRSPEPGVLLTLDQVAQELGCSRKHVERLIKSKELVATRIGSRSVRVHRRDLDAFCAWKRDDRR
jgi:excisionase family DNA binding protein